MSEVKMYPVF